MTAGGTTIGAGDTVLVSVPQANRAADHCWPGPSYGSVRRTDMLIFGVHSLPVTWEA